MPQSITRSFTYMGVWADSPPNMKIHDKAPTTGDSQGVKLGDFWEVRRDIANPIPDELWYLARWTAPKAARWLKLYPQGGGGGGGGNLRADDGNIAIPDGLDNINVYGGNLPYININTTRTIDANTLSVNLNRSIFQPASNQTASEGMYSLGGEDFLYAYGHTNTFCGMSCGNRTLDVVTAINNTAQGKDALNSIHESAGCTALGSQALTNLLDGTDNISIGFNSGLNLVNDESDNILVGSLGENLDNHTIRLGIMGVGAAEQDKFFAAGIWNGIAQVPVKDTGLVLVDEDGKCYVDDIAPDCVIFTDATGNPIGVQGAPGTVLTGMGAAAPQFLAFQPDDPVLPTVTTAIDPITGAIILTAHAGGIAGVTNIPTDIGGPVVPLAGALSVLGGDLINTDGTVANIVTVNLDRSATNLQVIGGNGAGAASTYKTLKSTNGTILFDVATDPTSIDMSAVGGGGGGIARLTGDDPVDVPATAASVQIEGGKNIYTNTTIDKVTVNVTDDVTLLGFLHAADEVQSTGGDLIATIGKLILPDTDGAGVGGQIVLGGSRFFHNYGVANVFVGEDSGSFAINTAQSQYNTALGFQTLQSLTNVGPGDRNTAIGYFCLKNNQTGAKNCALGAASLGQLQTGNYNTAIGYHGGWNYNGAQSNNICIANAGNVADGTLGGHGGVIRIGNMGVGANDQEDCYIAGIYGSVVGPAPLMVTCGSNGKLSTQAVPGGGIVQIAVDGDVGNFVVNAALPNFSVKGGANINTVAVLAGRDITVNLDTSILQPKTNAVDGIYALGAVSHSNDRFMHNYGTGNTFLGWQSGVLAGVGGVSLVGIGMNVLDAVVNATDDVAVGKNSMTAATSAARCTCVGSGSGSALTTGADQILIGYQAGNVYATSNHNIVLGNATTVIAGEAAENCTTRIGYREVWTVVGPDKTHPDPVNFLVQSGTNAAYMYGIYNKDVAATASVVYVDDTGKLGTNGAVGFEYYKTINTPTVTGDGTPYTFLDADFTKSFDNRTSVNPGVGGRLEFIAPFAGKYVITACVIYTNVTIPRTSSPLSIMTSNNSYQYKATPYAGGAAAEISEILTVFTFLDQFDKAWFTAYWAGGTKTVGIGGVSGGLIRTYVSGYRMQ